MSQSWEGEKSTGDVRVWHVSKRQARRFSQRRNDPSRHRYRRLELERLENRHLLAGFFDVVDAKFRDGFNQLRTTISDLFSPDAAESVSGIFSDAYDNAVAKGSYANQVTENPVLSAEHSKYVDRWRASESGLGSQSFPSTLEVATKNLGELLDSATRETLATPTDKLMAGATAVCWVIAPFTSLALTPVCAALTIDLGKDYAFNFYFGDEGAANRAIDNSPWSQSTKDLFHKAIDAGQWVKDSAGLREDLLDAKAFVNSPDLVERVYKSFNATTSFINWVESTRDNYEDLMRSSDAPSTQVLESIMVSDAIRFRSRRIGEAVLEIDNERSLTASERQAVSGIFIDSNFTTDFLGFTSDQTRQLLEAVGPVNEFVRLEEGQVLILGTDGADTIDVFSSQDVVGILEITVNDDPTVYISRDSAPSGVVIYSQGGNDKVSIRADISSLISAGAGDDVVTGGWGPDHIRGGPGNDRLIGREGDDLLSGDWGDDELRGGSGNNILSGGSGNNIVVDNHTLVPFQDVAEAHNLVPAPPGVIPILKNVNATTDHVAANEAFAIDAIGADGNGGSLARFEVWEFGPGGKLLGVDKTSSDGYSVEINASTFGGIGTFKTISRVYGTNGVASNWVARNIIVSPPAFREPVIEDFVRTPLSVTQGSTLTMEAYVEDPDHVANFVQFVWDRDGSETVTTGDTILGNGSKLTDGVSTYTLPITEAYSPGVQRFLVRARYADNTEWTSVVARAIEVNAPPNSAPAVTSLTPSSSVLGRGLTLTLTANVVDGLFPTTEVHFYWDSDNNGVLDPTEDIDLGHDTSSSGGWTRRFGTSDFPLGENIFFARAEDGNAHDDYVVGSTTVTLRGPDAENPKATLLSSVNVTVAGNTAYAFQILYEDDVAIDSRDLGDDDARVVGPDGVYNQSAVLVDVDDPSDGSPRVATYVIEPPGGSWDESDNASYRIYVSNNEVSDTSEHFVPFGELGTFSVNIADSTPPSVVLNGLSADLNQPTRITRSNLSVSGEASDPESGIADNQYHFFLSRFRDGTWEEPIDLGATGSSMSVSGLSDGLYSLSLQAENGIGLTADSLNGFFVIDALTDVVVHSAIGQGGDKLKVSFSVVSVASKPIQLGFYRSSDATYDAGDALLDTILISAPGDLAVGKRTKVFTIGAGTNAVSLPGAGAADSSTGYQILVVADPADAVEEIDTDPHGEDNTVVLSGVYHRAGGNVYVHGTMGHDTITVRTGSVAIVFNGTRYNFPAGDVKSLRLWGHAGKDTLSLTGTPENESATVRIGSVDFVGTGYRVDADDFETVRVYGGGGTQDRAYLYDSAGNDRFYGRPDYSYMSGNGFFNYAKDFDRVYAYATGGGTDDRAYLYDSAGNDRFYGRPDYSYMSGNGFFNYAKDFDRVYAYATAGGTDDRAYLYDSSGNDQFVSRSDYALLHGSGFYNYANGFESVHAYASSGVDRVEFQEVLSMDLLFGRRNYARLTGPTRFDWAYYFDFVTARAKTGETPTADVRDVDYVFDKMGSWK